MTGLIQDIRFALRSFRRNPGFTAVVLAVLALGTGANTAMFSVVDAVVLRPLPYASPDQLVVVGLGRQRGRPGRGTASWPTFRDWQAHSRTVAQMAAYHGGVMTLTGEGTPELLPVVASTANLFQVLGVPPALGRGFAAGEDLPGRNRVVVLSDGLWRRRFAGDPAIVGRVLTLDGASHTVIGVAPPFFQFPPTQHGGELWVPVPQGNLDLEQNDRSLQLLQLVGRLAPGSDLTAAQAELETIKARLDRQYPAARVDGVVLTAVGLKGELVGSVREAMLTLLIAVGVVLLIACANVANLMLARATDRARELAVRAALGAGRARIVRQLLTESVLLSLAGGLLGVGLAYWCMEALLTLVPTTLPRPNAIAIDARVLVFTAFAALSTSLVFGVVPALHAARADVHASLKQAGRTTGPVRPRLRSVLLLSEIALSFVLLVGAGLVLRSFARVTDVDAGFDARGLLTANVSLPEARYHGPARLDPMYRRLVARVRELPGVEDAALAMPLPYTSNSINLPYVFPGEPAAGIPRTVPARFVSPEYFRAMGIRLLKGRLLAPSDEIEGAPAVAVVSERFARDQWGGDPVGRRIEVTVAFRGPRRIVGVVSDTKERLEEASSPRLYLPFYQPSAQVPLPNRVLVVRTRDPAGQVQPVRAVLADLDPALPLGDVQTMEQRMDGSLQQRRLTTTLLALFAGLALLLAAAGIYGVLSYTVSQRTRELGVRMALGAQRGQMLGMVLGQGVRLALLGLVIGMGAALALTRLIASQLYDTSPTDPTTFAALALLLLVVTTAAALVPARRATRVDPMVALRSE